MYGYAKCIQLQNKRDEIIDLKMDSKFDMQRLFNDDFYKFNEKTIFDIGYSEAHISFNDIIIIKSIIRRWNNFTKDFNKIVQTQKQLQKESLRKKTIESMTDPQIKAIFDVLTDEEKE